MSGNDPQRSRFRRLAALPCGRRGKWVVLLVWILLAVVFGPLAGKLTGVEKNVASSYLPASAESTKVLRAQNAFQPPNVTPAVIVYTRSTGLTPADLALAASARAQIEGTAGVIGAVPPPVPSADGKAVVIAVQLNGSDTNALVDKVKAIRALVVPPAGNTDLKVYVTGPAGNAADALEIFKKIDGTLLYATVVVVVLVLLATYRSPFLWVVPVIAAAMSLILAEGVNYLLAKHAGLTVNGQSAGILLVLVFGAGTDYALLLVARYREELHRHADKHEAMAFALGQAAPAILASGATVIISLLCLFASQLNSNRGLGPVAAIGIACALMSMTTLLPALLTIAPRRVFWPFVPRYGTPSHAEGAFWGRTGRRIARQPRQVWVGTVLVLGVLCLGLTNLSAHGLSNKDSYTTKPQSVQGQTVLDQHFPAGVGSPVVVIANASSADTVSATVKATPGIAELLPPAVAGNRAQIEAVLVDPPDSAAAYATIDRLRAAVHPIPGADALVGGTTAINLDVQHAADHDRALIIPLVLVVVLGILMLVLRAVVAALVLIGTVVLSFAAALGASAFAFQHIFRFAGADSSYPLFVFIFLVALGIDYNIFLMTRVREETARVGTEAGMLKGLAVTGGVITSAGVVLAATFSVLGVLPLVTLAEVGFAVAFGVLLDTFLVRSILVPALTLDIGSRIWWPSSLDRHPAATGVPPAAEPSPRP